MSVVGAIRLTIAVFVAGLFIFFFVKDEAARQDARKLVTDETVSAGESEAVAPTASQDAPRVIIRTSSSVPTLGTVDEQMAETDADPAERRELDPL